jgi:cyclic-di-GMP-binding protein
MPSFDIVSEVDQIQLKNAVDVASRKLVGRHDFQNTSAKVELSDKQITVHADSDFQLEQIERIVYPELTAKKIDIKCLEKGTPQKISGNKLKCEYKVRVGIEQELSKKIVKLLKDSKLKVQAAIQGDAVRVTGAKKDILQDAIALVRKEIIDFPVQFNNFRD